MTNGIRAHWRTELRNGSSYFRQIVEFSAPKETVPIYAVELADVHIAGTKTIGTAPGCPVAGNGMFFGVEMPGAENFVTDAGAHIGFPCKLELSPRRSPTRLARWQASRR